jgi:hypothetical protein
MIYTASSVKKALLANKDLDLEWIEDLGCPKQRCGEQPDKCMLAHDKKCKQRVNVFYRADFFRPLNFYFTISPVNNDGFIDAKDTALRLLINEKAINLEILQQI